MFLHLEHGASTEHTSSLLGWAEGKCYKSSKEYHTRENIYILMIGDQIKTARDFQMLKEVKEGIKIIRQESMKKDRFLKRMKNTDIILFPRK